MNWRAGTEAEECLRGDWGTVTRDMSQYLIIKIAPI